MNLTRLLVSAGLTLLKNPMRELLEEAEEEFRGFHWGRRPKRVRRAPMPETRGVLVEIGELLGVPYRTAKGEGEPVEDWIHWFSEPRPRLAYDPETRDLFILGGRYTVTDRGVED